MAFSLNPDKSYVIYESYKKKRNFYCIERTGYVKVSDLVNDFLYHAVDVHNAMTVCNIRFVETYRVDSAVKFLNPEFFEHNYTGILTERRRELSFPGNGYQVGDELEFTDPNAVINGVQIGRETLKLRVTAIDPNTGGIDDFVITHPGSYNTPASTNKLLNFRIKKNSFAADVINKDISYDTDLRGTLAAGYTNETEGNIFIFQSRHEGIGNVWVATVPPGTIGDPALGYWQYGPTVHKPYKGTVARCDTTTFSGPGGPTLTTTWTWYHQDISKAPGTNIKVAATYKQNRATPGQALTAASLVPSNLGYDPWTQTFGQSHSTLLTTPFIPFGSGETTGGRGGEGDPTCLANIQAELGGTFTYGYSYDAANQIFFGNLTRWPVDGIWTNVDVLTNTTIFPGQELILVETESNSESYIPPGTIITSVNAIQVVNGVRELKSVKPSVPTPTSNTWYGVNQFYETTARYLWFQTNKSIKIDKGDRFVVRGNGALLNDTITDTPEKFTVITESAASADALSDTQGFTANITGMDLTGANLFLSGMTTSHSRINAYPYHGQLMTIVTPSVAAAKVSYSIVGNLLCVISNIANVNVDNGTANITVAVPQGAVLQGSTVKFNFPFLQPWRMAFKADGPQQLNVHAATKIQLQDNGLIAKITDYSGTVNDLTGLTGNAPTIKVFDTKANGQIVNANIQFGHNRVPGAGGVWNTTANLGVLPTGIDANFVCNISGFATVAQNGRAFVTDVSPVPIVTGMEFNINSGIPPYQITDNKILYQITPLRPYESLGQIGRYVVEINNSFFSPIANVDYVEIGHVKDVEIDQNDITQGFVNRTQRVAQHPESYPLSFVATFTTRGIFFGVWEGSWTVMQKSRARQVSERDAWFNWLLCQRPVDRKTGQTRTSGQSPVFCINSVGYKYWKFIVREKDTVHPTQGDKETQHYVYDKRYLPNGGIYTRYTPWRVPADKHTEDSHAVLNTTEQIALTEDSKYLVSFLYNLTTPRFRYSDELDMIGQTAADVAMSSNNLYLRTYGEPNDRTYRSMGANLPYNMGLRIVVLTDLYQN